MAFNFRLCYSHLFNIMKKYLAWDFDNHEHEEFETIEEAREYLEECFLNEEGYSPDTNCYKIFVLSEKVEVEVIADKSDFTDEEWEEAGHNSDHDEIWKHRFVKS